MSVNDRLLSMREIAILAMVSTDRIKAEIASKRLPKPTTLDSRGHGRWSLQKVRTWLRGFRSRQRMESLPTLTSETDLLGIAEISQLLDRGTNTLMGDLTSGRMPMPVSREPYRWRRSELLAWAEERRFELAVLPEVSESPGWMACNRCRRPWNSPDKRRHRTCPRCHWSMAESERRLSLSWRIDPCVHDGESSATAGST